MQDNDERYPCTFEADALDALGLDPGARALIRRILVTSETTMVIEIGTEMTVTVAVHPPIAEGRPWTIRVERTLVREGSTTVAATDMPVDAIGRTQPALPHRAVIEAALTAAAEDEARQLARIQSAREFYAVLSWIFPGAFPKGDAAVALMEGRGAVRWERRGGDVILTLEVNAGPAGPTAPELFR